MQEHLEIDNLNGEDSNKAKSTQNNKQSKLNKNDGTNTPPQISCVETICDIIVEQLPDLWRLGQSYFTGQLHVAVDAEKQTPFKVQQNIYQIKNSISIKKKINYFGTESGIVKYATCDGSPEKYM